MNCIWLLLIIAFCGNNGCRNCSRRNCGWDSNDYNNCNDYDNYDNYNNRSGRESTCENVCETVCEAARDAVEEASDQSCGCHRTFPFTSYPVLDNYD